MMDLKVFFEQERSSGADLIIAIVIATEGSTYRKPGAYMLLSSSGRRAGLLSGGCLEGDLHERALKMLADDRRYLRHRYDNRSSDDPVWGLGLGCEGSMTILLARCGIAEAYEPLASVFSASVRNEPIDINLDSFVWRIEPPPRVLICGAGPDAEPLFEFAHRLGWKVSLIDHRSAYALPDRFVGAELVTHIELERWSADIALDHYSAAVVMSHHLGADARYLEGLADSKIPYIGLLGPPARRERLMLELGAQADSLNARLRAPVGLNLGGRTPEAIALSIVAELQATLSSNAV